MTVLCSMPKHTWNSGEDSLHHTELGFPISLINSLRLTMQRICTVMLPENTLKAGRWPQLRVRGPKRTPKRLPALIAQVRQARAWWQSSEHWKASRCLIGAADSPNWNRSRAVTCRCGSVAFVFEICSGSASIGTVVFRRCCLEWGVGAQMHQWPSEFLAVRNEAEHSGDTPHGQSQVVDFVERLRFRDNNCLHIKNVTLLMFFYCQT